jgi:FKBP-type peptidyl-prolyl cis-trans isomerase
MHCTAWPDAPLSRLSSALNKENLPVRDINKLDRGRFDVIAKSIISDKLGYEPSDTELSEEFAKYEKKNIGTLTKVEKKYNKTTKQYENVRTTTPGLTEEDIQAGIGKSAVEADPDRAQRQEAFSFVSDFNKIMSGGI